MARSHSQVGTAWVAQADLRGRAETEGVIPGRFALSVGKPDLPEPNGWKWTKLTSVARLESGHTPSRRHPEYWGGDVPWIGIKDANAGHGRTIASTIEYASPLGIENSAARILPKDTVCLSRTASIGYIVVMGRPMATSQDFVNWVCSDRLNPQFLKYVLLGERDSLIRFAHGTTHQTIYFPEVKAFHVCLPSRSEQDRIVEILGSLDDKIDLNRHMNETLEATARAIFKAWFVDLEALPVEAGRPEREAKAAEGAGPYGNSNGWRVGEVGDIAEVVDCLHSKKPERRAVGRPLLQLSNIVNFGLLDTADSYLISESDYRTWSGKFEARGGDCVITNVGRVGAVAQVPEGYRAALGRNMTGLRCRADFPFPTFLVECLRSNAMKEEIVRRTDAGTILDALNVRSIPRLALRLPPVRMAEQFERSVRPIRRRLELNMEESRTLAALRDTLLPKLLSGEVRVKDIA